MRKKMIIINQKNSNYWKKILINQMKFNYKTIAFNKIIQLVVLLGILLKWMI